MESNNKNLRERRLNTNSVTSDQKLQPQRIVSNPKEISRKKFKSYCILMLLFLFPLILVPILPYLQLNKPKLSHYIRLPKPMRFEGNLEKNTLLQNAIHFGEGKVLGPEAIIFVNDTLFATLVNGQIVQMDLDGNLRAVTQSITETDKELCSDFGQLAMSKKQCGRPLGLRFKAPNFIYFVDAYHGLFKFNIETNEKIQLLNSNDDEFKKHQIAFFNDLDLDDAGNIFFTSSSSFRDVHEAVELFFEASPDGRLFRFNENTKELALLVDNLHFPNGVQLTPEKSAVIVAETTTARLMRYHINGAKQGHRETFIELPGFPDNIRMSEHNTLFVSYVAPRESNLLTVIDVLGEYPLLRTIFGTILNLRKIMFALPKYGLITEHSFDGSILRSWHDPSGKVIRSISTTVMHKNKLYLGSYYENFIGIVDY